MILVDSSVWIDFFNGVRTETTDYLDAALSDDQILVGDLILAEVLQGFRSDRDYRIAESLLMALTIVPMMNLERALSSVRNYRRLRKQGLTVRSSIDVWIATFCIDNRLPLLFSDRDFQPFIEHLSLKSALVS